jgi:hypothetical protein
MNVSTPRVIAVSAATASILALSLAISAVAQVATLADPAEDEPTPVPMSDELAGEEAVLEFASCMRDNGIDMDDPQFGVNGARFGPGPSGDLAFDIESAEFQAAFDTCGSYLEAMLPDFDAAQQAEIADRTFEVSLCMRERGWEDFPDLGGSGVNPMAVFRQIEDAGIDVEDPAFQEDATACQSEAGLDEFAQPGA